MISAKGTAGRLGTSTARIDGRAKVTGDARYASDVALSDPAFAFLATSRIARGRIAGIDESETRAIPAVLDVLTYRKASDDIKPVKFFSDGGYMSSSIMPLKSDQVWYAGQIIAVVLAETFEAAREGAQRLNVT